jgi:YjbE family integral membrane protein
MTYIIQILGVAWVNILLSGDNAIVIALACRGLPDNQRRIGVWAGSGAAIALRILFAFVITWLLDIPYLQAVGGALLIWIAIQLARGGSEDEQDVKAHASLWAAVGTIAVADAAMSLDNVIAIAAIARDDYWLFIFGLVLSIPLIVVGASLISALLGRFPVLVWAGSALLGLLAGEMIADDAALLGLFKLEHNAALHYGAAVAGAILVTLIAWQLARRDARSYGAR